MQSRVEGVAPQAVVRSQEADPGGRKGFRVRVGEADAYWNTPQLCDIIQGPIDSIVTNATTGQDLDRSFSVV